MSRHTGHIELNRTVESIVVGNRHRTDLGDLTALAESIARDGLLQPLTVTIDGVLVCGARRLAAIKMLGWRTVSVWVRSGISGRLGHLLAEQDDNMLHKDLTPVEAAALYRELKTLMAEDAARRQAATRFSAENQPGKDGAGKFPAPSEPVGRASEQAAAMIPGGASYKTLDKIDYLRQVTDDPDLPATVRGDAAAELERIDAGGPGASRLRAHPRRRHRDRKRDHRPGGTRTRGRRPRAGGTDQACAGHLRGRGRACTVAGARVRRHLERACRLVDALRRRGAGERTQR